MTVRDIVKVENFLNAKYGKITAVHARGHRPKAQQLDPAARAAMGDDATAFFDAEYQPATGQWSLGKRVMDREW